LNFASINTHNFYEQSRRDDLESVAYMLIYFFFGELDWINDKNDNEYNINSINLNEFGSENEYVRSKKESIVSNSDIPKVILEFYKNVRALEFKERPTYEKYIHNFREELNIL
jgi:hypothetical protein